MYRQFFLLLLLAADPKREAESLLRVNPADERAGELLERAIAEDSGDAEAHYLLGRWALVKGHYLRAVEAETRAAQLSPSNAAARMQAWTIIAAAYDQMNKSAEAEAAFRKALAVNRRLPSFDANAAHEYAAYLEREHRLPQAHALVDEILRVAPDHAPSRLSRAKRLFAARKYSAAVVDAEFALGGSQGNRQLERDAHYLLARVYLALGQPEKAEPHRLSLAN